MDVVLDFGNMRWKWFNPRTNAYGDTMHAIAPLSENDWRDVVGRGTPPAGYVRVNGCPFAVGEAARRWIIPERPAGAARYQKEYYGIGLAWALTESFQRSTRNIELFASHAPQDIKHAKRLRAAARGEYEVESQYGALRFNVRSVYTYDEPIGGFCHYTLTEKGIERKANTLTTKTTMIIDVGGFTVDFAIIDKGGTLDQMSLGSARTGVLKALEMFERELRGNNESLFQDVDEIDPMRLEMAMLTGVYPFGKRQIDCRFEADGVLNALTNEVVQIMKRRGGLANIDTFLVTGGGSALLFERFQRALPDGDFVMAEKNPALMKYANAFGGAKYGELMRLAGEL